MMDLAMEIDDTKGPSDEAFDFLSYADPGTIVFTIHAVRPTTRANERATYVIEIEDFWGDCALLIAERQGLERWIRAHVNLELAGTYVIEGITGTYVPGELGVCEDEVDYRFALVRRASETDLTGHARPIDKGQSTGLLAPILENPPYEWPSYRQVGTVIVEIYHVYAETWPYTGRDRYEMEILDYSGGCALLIAEGEGFEYWIEGHLEVEQPGIYVIDGITGTYHRGEWGFTDDTVDYDFASVRYATEQDMASLLRVAR